MSTVAEDAPVASTTDVTPEAVASPTTKPNSTVHFVDEAREAAQSTVHFEGDVRTAATRSRMSELANPILDMPLDQAYYSTQAYEDVSPRQASQGTNSPDTARNDARRTEMEFATPMALQPGKSGPRPTAPHFFADDNHVGVHQRVTRARSQATNAEGELTKEYTEEHEKQFAPGWAKIGAFLIIAVLAGITNSLMVMIQYWLNKFRLTALQHYWSAEQDGNYLTGALGSAGVAAFYCGFAAILVLFLAPKAAGSGLPEMKGYLNGCKIAGMFGQMGWVRAIGAIFTVSSGMPLGREGPMVSTGGQIGISIVDYLMKRFYMEKIDESESDSKTGPAKKVLDVARFRILRRQGAMLGAAAGVAAAFNAPIGACLYIYEEVAGVMKWDAYLTTMALTVSVVATYVSYAILNSIEFTRSHLGALVLTGAVNRNEGNVQYNGYDVMGAICVGIVTALFSRIFAKCLLKVAKMRSQHKWNNMLRLAEVMCCVFIVAFFLGITPEMFSCSDLPKIANGHAPSWTCGLTESTDGRRMLAGGGKELSTHNEVATFNIQGLESGLQYLLDQSPHHYSLATLFVAFVVQVLGCLLIFSLPMPIGMFIPNLFFGAIIGRFMGEVFYQISPETTYARPGVFAFWGMGGALAGFSHMTIAIATLIVEATHDIANSVPLVACIIVARLIAGLINHEGFDEEMLVLKNVPFLHHEMPKALNRELAGHLMEATPPEAQLKDTSTILAIGHALHDCPKLLHFPVINEKGQVIGVVDRKRLTKLFLQYISPAKYAHLNMEEAMAIDTAQEAELEHKHAKTIRNYFAVHKGTMEIDDHTPLPDTCFPLKQLMEPTRFLVIASMPCARFYNLFVTTQLTCVTVVDSKGAPVGVIPRENLVKSTTEAPRERFLEVKKSFRRTTQTLRKKLTLAKKSKEDELPAETTLETKKTGDLSHVTEVGVTDV